MSLLRSLLAEIRADGAVPNTNTGPDSSSNVPSGRKRPQRDSPVVLVVRLKARLAAMEQEKNSVEASLAHQHAQHPIGKNGYCGYNANNFEDVGFLEALQRENKALWKETSSLRENQYNMNKQNDYRIHQIEMGSMRRQLAKMDIELARAHVQLHQAHTVLAENGLPIPQAGSSRRSEFKQSKRPVPSSQLTGEINRQSAAAEASEGHGVSLNQMDPTPNPADSSPRTPRICLQWWWGKCQSSDEECARRGFLHDQP